MANADTSVGMSGPATLGLEGRLGYTVRVPESWYEVDVHPATRDDSIRRLVEDRVRGNQEMWDARRAVIKILRDQARRAYETGATYAAGFAMPTDEGPITGSLIINLVRGPIGAGDEPDRAGHLQSLFKTTPRGKGEFDTYAASGSVEIESCGPCARSWGIEDVTLEDGRTSVRNVFMQTAIPVPGFNKVFLVSASSPSYELHEEMLDLFDAITGTFRLVDLTVQTKGS